MPDSRITDEQSRRTIREELLTNILVEAGAGSGKTQMLAERMAAGVAEGVYQIEHMAAVTFTRKAASELRGRFHLALEARLVSARKAQGARSGDPAAAGGALESGALLRRHHSLVLRAAAARASRGVRRVAGLHRAGRSAGPRVAPACMARVHHQRARGGRPGRGGVARGRHQAEGPRLGVRDGLRQRRCGIPAGDGTCPDPNPGGESAGEVLEDLPEAHAFVDRRRRQVRDAARGAARSRASGAWRRSGSIDRPSSRPCSHRGTASPRSP